MPTNYRSPIAYPTAESRDMATPAAKVWSLVSDLPWMGEWSPENAGGKWVKGATGPAKGARFRGTNKRGHQAAEDARAQLANALQNLAAAAE
jgi:hypothetical protein